MRWPDSARSTHQQLIPGRYNGGRGGQDTPRSTINTVPVFVFFARRSENPHRLRPPKIGGTASDHLSEARAAPYAGSAVRRDGMVAHCSRNKLVVSKDKHHSLWKRLTKEKQEGLVYLCSLCCRPSGEKKSLERKSSADMNAYQIRVWTAAACTRQFRGNINLILSNTLAYSQDAVKNRSPAALSHQNKRLIQLLQPLDAYPGAVPLIELGAVEFKKKKRWNVQHFRLLYNCRVLLRKHTQHQKKVSHCKRATVPYISQVNVIEEKTHLHLVSLYCKRDCVMWF